MQEEQLTHRLHELAETPPSAAPTGRLLERGRRARHRRTTVTSVSLAAVVALGTIGGVAVATSGTPDRPTASASVDGKASAADPRLELVAAIASTENISFRLKATTTHQKGDGKVTVPPGSWEEEVAFDPATATGYWRTIGGGFEFRLVDGVKYQKNGERQWLRYQGTFSNLGWSSGELRDEIGHTADPQQLLKMLKDGGGTVTKSGASAYHFEVAGRDPNGKVTLVGDITLDADKHVAKVTYDWKLAYDQGGFQQSKVVQEYSGYGEPVTVEVPSNVIPLD